MGETAEFSDLKVDTQFRITPKGPNTYRVVDPKVTGGKEVNAMLVGKHGWFFRIDPDMRVYPIGDK
jgi:hypothetical protein